MKAKKVSYMTRRLPGRTCSSMAGIKLDTALGCNTLNLELGGAYLGTPAQDDRSSIVSTGHDLWPVSKVDYDDGQNSKRRTLFYVFEFPEKGKKERKGVCFNANTNKAFGVGQHDDMKEGHANGDYSKLTYIWKAYYNDIEYWVDYDEEPMLPFNWLKCTKGGPAQCRYHGEIVFDAAKKIFKTCVFAGEKPAFEFNGESGAQKTGTLKEIDTAKLQKQCVFFEDIPAEEKANLEGIIKGETAYTGEHWGRKIDVKNSADVWTGMKAAQAAAEARTRAKPVVSF